MELAGAADGARHVDPIRVLHATRDRRLPVRGGAAGRPRERRRAVRAGRERSSSLCPARIRASPRPSRSRRWRRRTTSLTSALAVLAHRTKRSGLRLAAAMDHFVTGTSRAQVASGSRCRLGARRGDRYPRARTAAADRQVRRLRLVGRTDAARDAGPGRSPRWPPHAATGWDELLADQRAIPRRVLGPRRRRARWPSRAAAGRAVRALSCPLGRRARPRAAPSQPKG